MINYYGFLILNNESCTYLKGLTITAVIVPNSVEDQHLAENVCIGIEFKKPNTIMCNETHQQLLLEFIAAASKRSNKNLPILFVCTDFYTFQFVSLPVQRDRIIHFYQT